MSTTVLDGVLRFIDDLRGAGVSVPTGATVDAANAISVIDIGRRNEVRIALRATLIKRPEDLAAFEALFDRRYPAPRSPISGGGVSHEGLRASMVDALARGDYDALAALAEAAADRFGGSGMAGTGRTRNQMQRVLRALELSNLAQQALRARRDAADDADAIEAHLARSEVSENVRAFQELLRQGILRRAPPSQDWGPLPADQVEFSSATSVQLREMRQAVGPLARKLASRMDTRRHHHQRRGPADFRRTIHRSLSTGGAPVELAFRHRRRTRSELWVLCDTSGSVAEFAMFLLGLVAALKDQLPRTRAFCFVDRIDEVTAVLAANAHPLDAFAALARASRAGGRRRSDYGQALEAFWTHHGTEVTATATVLVCGDARSHHQDPKLHLVRAIAARARHVWLLNPEPRRRWDLDDSVASAFGRCCDGTVEVRNLAQLTQFVSSIG